MEWMPIESLPESLAVLMWNGDFVTIGARHGGIFFDYAETNLVDEFDGPPTHWMPLPEPPK